MSDSLQPAIPAATIILYQEDASGPARHLMIERTARMAFVPEALVFPGGRVETSDHELAADSALVHSAPEDIQDAASRIAAIRETIEEVGIPIGIWPTPTAELVVMWRTALKSGSPLGPLLAAAECHMDLRHLIPFARWCPNLSTERRFDTRFYIARAQGNAAVTHDVDEATHHIWLTAQEALDDAKSDRFHIIFPTLRNLERLALYPRFEEMALHLAATPFQTIMPKMVEYDGQPWLCIPEGADYPVTRILVSDHQRFRKPKPGG